MEILSSRVLLRPQDLERTLRFYEDTLGLPVYREWGEGKTRGVVFFLGGGLLEVSSTSDRKSTRLNSSHSQISYAVFCLKKKHGSAIEQALAGARRPAARGQDPIVSMASLDGLPPPAARHALPAAGNPPDARWLTLTAPP